MCRQSARHANILFRFSTIFFLASVYMCEMWRHGSSVNHEFVWWKRTATESLRTRKALAFSSLRSVLRTKELNLLYSWRTRDAELLSECLRCFSHDSMNFGFRWNSYELKKPFPTPRLYEEIFIKLLTYTFPYFLFLLKFIWNFQSLCEIS